VAESLVNGVRLHVQRLPPTGGRTPETPTVVMVHGMAIDNLSSLYFALGTNLAGAGADVICYDLRGHGRSERTPEGYTLPDTLSDLRALLAVLEVDGPVHVVGNSYGATAALAFGVAHPDAVASLTLIEPPFQIEGLGEEMARSLSDVAAGLSDEEIRDFLLNEAGRAMSRVVAKAEALLRDTTIMRDMLATPPFTPAGLRALRMPVLAIYGGKSEIAHQASGLADLVPDCELVVLTEHTHMVLREATHHLRELLAWWLFDRDAPRPTYVRAPYEPSDVPEWFSRMKMSPDLLPWNR
jgi:pimeloyl-ACP methyl ester carboxylesterase